MEKLNEAHAALGQPPRQQAIRRERAGLARVRAVQLKGARRLLRQIRQFRHRVCILYAISYCAMRVAISGSPNSSISS